MFCTACGASLGAWRNKSCPHCGAPLRPAGASTTPESPAPSAGSNQPQTATPADVPAQPPAKPVWLLIAAVFVLIVGGLWWGLGLDEAPIVDPKSVRTQGAPPDATRTTEHIIAPPEDTGSGTPDEKTVSTTVPDVEPPFPPPENITPQPPASGWPEPLPPKVPDPDPPPKGKNSPVIGPKEPKEPKAPPETQPRLPRPPRPPRPPPGASPSLPPLPPDWLDAIRDEQAACNSYFCHARVQRKYCEGYWNRLKECKKNGNGL